MERRKPATINDIAERLGLAVSTVSYAINNGPRSVSEDVRTRVWEVAEEIGYKNPRLKRVSSPKLTRLIAVVAQVGREFFVSPYIASLSSSMLDEARKRGYDLSFITRGSDARREDLIDSLLSGRYDAAIVFDGVAQSTIRRIVDAGLPMLAISSDTPPKTPNFEIDNESGLLQSLGHLYALGHREMAYFHGPLDLHDANARIEVFKQFVSSHNVSCPQSWFINGGFKFTTSYQAAHRLLSTRQIPTAIVAGNDESAAGIIAALSEHGLRAPNDISIVGFDDLPIVGVSSSTLTTVRQPIAEIGKSAVEAICTAIENKSAVSSRKFLTELIVRNSTGSPRSQRL